MSAGYFKYKLIVKGLVYAFDRKLRIDLVKVYAPDKAYSSDANPFVKRSNTFIKELFN